MQQAWIEGSPAALDRAIAEAAKLLDASHHPLIAGLGTDIAGARAAILLAQRTGAVIDHMNSDALLRDLDVMRSSGVMLTTPGESAVRADTLLLVGSGLAESWPEFPQRLFGKLRKKGSPAGVERRAIWLCPGRDSASLPVGGTNTQAVGREPRDLPMLLAALRARSAGRPAGKACISSRKLDEVTTNLKAARFGVAIWSAATIDALVIEMLCGLVSDLNAATRFSALPLGPAHNAIGVLQACGWMTGFPMRTGFGRGYPRHDPWLFASRRLVDSGETDCILWISAYAAQAPGWRETPPTIALTGPGAKFSAPPRVHIAVGRPGVDHGGVEHLLLTGTMASLDAATPSDAVSVADAITRIVSALPGSGERPC
jgi:formylmethanofuran dehydrogenase subunit B